VLEIDPIPARPSRAQAAEALEDLSFLISTYPFVDGIDRAVALSALMTPVLRSAMDVAPMHVFTAPTPGSGKTALTHLPAILALGQKGALTGASDDPIEVEKRLISCLISGASIIAMDNLSGSLRSNILAQGIEQECLRIRPLGEKNDVFVLNVASFFGNGNGLQVEADLLRRILRCLLDPEVERPELRRFDFDPLELAHEQRAKFVRAILLLGVFGMQSPPREEPPLASFGRWDMLIRRPLLILGCGDPVMAMERTRSDAADLSGARIILSLLYQAFGDRPFTVHQVIEAVTKRDVLSKRDQASLGFEAPAKSNFSEHPLTDDEQGELREALLTEVGNKGAISGRSLGKWLLKNKKRIYGNKRILEAGQDELANVKKYCVTKT
jgi:putative DNA primase/helicase